jgi:hypothetical protein
MPVESLVRKRTIGMTAGGHLQSPAADSRCQYGGQTTFWRLGRAAK